MNSFLIPINKPRAGGGIIWNPRIWNLDRDVNSFLIPINKPRAGALGSLTECPLDIRPFGYVSSPIRVRELTLKPSKPPSYQLGCSVRSPNVRIVLIYKRAFRKPRAGALGSLTECLHFVDMQKGISEASRGGARFAHRMSTGHSLLRSM